MEKLSRRKEIESLSSEQLAQELINNGYAFSYRAVIDNDITGKKLLNMTWSEKEDLHSTMSTIQLAKFWLFVISVQNNPTNFYHNLNNYQEIKKESAFSKNEDLFNPPVSKCIDVLMVSRDEAEYRLRRCEFGSFFFRKSNKFHCVLVVKMDKKKIAHIPVLKDDIGLRLLVVNRSTYFDNLDDLVRYYQMRHIEINCETVRLKYFLEKL